MFLKSSHPLRLAFYFSGFEIIKKMESCYSKNTFFPSSEIVIPFRLPTKVFRTLYLPPASQPASPWVEDPVQNYPMSYILTAVFKDAMISCLDFWSIFFSNRYCIFGIKSLNISPSLRYFCRRARIPELNGNKSRFYDPWYHSSFTIVKSSLW